VRPERATQNDLARNESVSKKRGINNMAELISVGGEITEVAPSNGKLFSMEELQAHVGGYFQVVPQHLYPARVFLCDEDGQQKKLEPNDAASIQLMRPMVGNVLVISHDEWD
tara:strand:- start:37 stop:372 length:336 start_codon:yes stop_codon:yes gene_type:complete